MIQLKSNEEIAKIRASGEILGEVRHQLERKIEPGVTTLELDRIADRLIREKGGESGFKKVKNYHWTLCTPVNEEVVHTPPSRRSLKKGDILTIDMGVYLDGYHSDYAWTTIVGQLLNPKVDKFLKTGKEVLNQAITQVKPGNYIGHISQAIQSGIVTAGFSVVKELTGHGIGRKLHEDPLVPGFLKGSIEKTPKLENGLVLAIEVIYTMGKPKIDYTSRDGWSIVTADGSIAACFEDTVALYQNKVSILT